MPKEAAMYHMEDASFSFDPEKPSPSPGGPCPPLSDASSLLSKMTDMQ